MTRTPSPLDAARWIIGSAALAACFLALRGPIEAAYWTHLAIGRILAAHHLIAATNPFVYTAPADAPVLLQPWIGQFWLHELHEFGGLQLVVGLRNLLFAATIAAIGWRSWKLSGNAARSAVATLVVGIAAAWATPLGPELFAFPLIAATMLILSASEKPTARVVALTLVAALWANLAPGFAIAPMTASVIVLAWMRLRRPFVWQAMASVASLAATLLTPYGVAVWQAAGEAPELFIVALLFAAQLVAARNFGERPPTGRHPAASIAAIVASLAVAVAIQPWFALHAPLATALHSSARQTVPLRGLVSARLPVESVEVVRAWGSRPRVFIAPEFAGYYVYRIAAAAPLPLVPRDDVFGLPDHDTSLLIETLRREPASLWRGMFQQWGVTTAILDRTLDAELVEAMSSAPDWRVLFTHEDQVLVQRLRAQNPPPNRK